MGEIINTNFDFKGEELNKEQLIELIKNSLDNKRYKEMLDELNKMNKHLSSITGKELE